MENESELDPRAGAIESLLKEMIANQQSLHNAIADVNEKISRLEQELCAPEDTSVDRYLEQVNLFERGDDDLYAEAVQAVRRVGRASSSYLQRKLHIGYSRAAQLMDTLEENEVIGPFDGSKTRLYIPHDSE